MNIRQYNWNYHLRGETQLCPKNVGILTVTQGSE
jgi:hypothetical protein